MHPNLKHPPFFGKVIDRKKEQEYIINILKKFSKEKVTVELKKNIHHLLTEEKYKGNITIPFKIVIRHDPMQLHPDYIEIILDSKV